MARSPIKLVPHVTADPDYQRLHGLGRLAIYLLEIGGQEVWIANVYGHTGGHTDTEAAQATDEIIQVAVEQIGKKINKCPVLILGDLNADLADLPVLCLVDPHEYVVARGVDDLKQLRAVHVLQRRAVIIP